MASWKVNYREQSELAKPRDEGVKFLHGETREPPRHTCCHRTYDTISMGWAANGAAFLQILLDVVENVVPDTTLDGQIDQQTVVVHIPSAHTLELLALCPLPQFVLYGGAAARTIKARARTDSRDLESIVRGIDSNECRKCEVKKVSRRRNRSTGVC